MKFISNINTSETDYSLKEILKKNKTWLAVSTHNGEEELCMKTHLLLKKKYENLITVIAPRHLNRINNIKDLCENLNLSYQNFKKMTIFLKKKKL